MRQMKDSGIEWIGQIPEEWKVGRVKNMFILYPYVKTNSVDSNFDVTFLPMENIKKGFYIDNERKFSDYTSSYNIFENDDILLAKVTPCFENGNIAIAKNLKNGIGFGTSEIFVIRSSGTNVKFIFYYLQGEHFRQRAIATMTGAGGLKRISPTFMKNETAVIPPLDEQQRIADYLDAQCARIDETMELVRQSKEKLRAYKLSLITEAVTKGLDPDVPMKDSGIPWIGDIPQSCKCVAVNKLFTLILGKMLSDSPKSESDTFEQYLCAMNVHFNGIDNTNLKKMWFSQKEKTLYKVNDGDLLIVEGGAGAGGAFLAENMCDKNIYIQNSIIIARENKEISSAKFLYYVIYSFVKRNYIDFICNKATIPHFTKEKIGNTKIVFFSLPEQQRIAAYLDAKCARIDALLAEKDELLDKLAEYKKSLIFECVTGKREVAA